MKRRIITWYTPDEKMPPEDNYVVVSVSGWYIKPSGFKVELDHALMIASWADDGNGWIVDGINDADNEAEINVHAWCDIEPYGWVKG